MDDKKKDEFISTLSHEIRTPLTSIKGFSKTILDNWDKIDEVNKKKFLNIILEQSNRLINLVENVLNAAKIDLDSEFVLKEINLLNLINNIADILKINYKDKKFKITSGKILNSMGDKDKLEQVFVNIIENACKYSSLDKLNKPVEIKIELKECFKKDFNVISVKNYGSFIEEKDREKVFEKFYRVENYLTSSAQGSGLGLYIAKTLIEKMGGKIEINSNDEENFTEFLVYVPVFEPEKMAKKIGGQNV